MRSVRNINDPADRPEVGTSEAAVSTCVSLIAGMCEQPEAIMEYWLDLYYFVRSAYERETLGQCPDIIRREDLLPELRKLWHEVLSVPLAEQLATTSSAAEAAPSPSLEKAKEKRIATTSVSTGLAMTENVPEAKATGTVKDQKMARPGNKNAAEAAAFKKATLERLQALRRSGMSIASIQEECRGQVDGGVIMDILQSEKVSIDKYRRLAKALDKIEEQGGTSREHEGTDTGAAGAGPAA